MPKKKRTWSLKGKLIPCIRKVFLYSPLRMAALQGAKKIVKGRTMYKCNKSKKYFPREDVTVDHIDPVVSVKKGFTDWNDYIARMFPPLEGLQVISKEYHKKKTLKENADRRKNKKK